VVVACLALLCPCEYRAFRLSGRVHGLAYSGSDHARSCRAVLFSLNHLHMPWALPSNIVGNMAITRPAQAFSQQLDGDRRAWCGGSLPNGDGPGRHPGFGDRLGMMKSR
jgi:hypothetical protein